MSRCICDLEVGEESNLDYTAAWSCTPHRCWDARRTNPRPHPWSEVVPRSLPDTQKNRDRTLKPFDLSQYTPAAFFKNGTQNKYLNYLTQKNGLN